MMKCALIVSASLALLALPASGADRIACPALLKEGAVAVVRAPAGWIGTAHAIMRLSGGGIMRGHPDQMGYLVPKATTRTRDGGTTTWEFEPGDERWLWCSYGGQAGIHLAKRLDDDAGDCSVTYKMSKQGHVTVLFATCDSAPMLPRDAAGRMRD